MIFHFIIFYFIFNLIPKLLRLKNYIIR